MIPNTELVKVLYSRSDGIIRMNGQRIKIAFDVTCDVCAEVYFGNPDRWGQPFLIAQFNRRELASLIKLEPVIVNGDTYSICWPTW